MSKLWLMLKFIFIGFSDISQITSGTKFVEKQSRFNALRCCYYYVEKVDNDNRLIKYRLRCKVSIGYDNTIAKEVSFDDFGKQFTVVTSFCNF